MTVPIDQIHVEEDFNPRRHIDDERINSLSKSIEQNGLLTPLTVRTNGTEGYKLIAGHRRLLAAKKAGLTDITIMIREEKYSSVEDDLPAALVENLHRSDLTTAEIVRGVGRMRESGYSSQKAIAEKLAIKPNAVKQAYDMLELGDLALELVEEHGVSPDTFRLIAQLSKVHKEAAQVVLRWLKRNPHSGRVIGKNPLHGLRDQIPNEPGFVPTFELDRSYYCEDIIGDDEGMMLVREYTEATNTRPTFVVTDDIIEQAETRGAVYRYKDPDATEHYDESTAAFFDPELASVLAIDALQAWAKTYAKNKEQAESDDENAPDIDGAIQPPKPWQRDDREPTEEEKKAASDQRKEERRKRLEDQVQGEAYNAELSTQVFERIADIKPTKQLIEAIVLQACADHGHQWLLKGLRYLHPGWITTTGEGDKTKKVYLENDAHGKVVKFIESSVSVEDCLARYMQLVTAARYADDRCLARTNRKGYDITGDSPVADMGLKKLTPAMQKKAESNYRARRKESYQSA